ncbi:DUF6261 family protein [Capnocytophaga felis]|uniref:Uncharacterized protein n=1 Tax=Capnocytophaga felis TaxID=2267611 RepID=A0A5M4B7S2_9FLAO|nr:DUF6261 family protein [Capnocytophaga felis]GET45654.1 hypothetical protein RCZ01_09560 [Capnocytophaga felis]GET47183.1 hypothetical protein RCZ02_00140 [Capnocytophaga felis]
MRNSNLIALDISKLYNAELAQLVTRFLDDFLKSNLDLEKDSDFKRLLESLRSQLPTFNAASDQIRGSSESSKIKKADYDRGVAFKSLKSALQAYQNTKEANEKDAYEALNLIISEYKGISRNSYEVQTNRLANLVERLQSSAYKNHVKELFIEKFVTRLLNANTHFDELFARRSFEISQRQNYDTKSLRKSILEDYRKLVNYVAAIAEVREDSFYKDTLTIINNSRKYFADIILSRRTKKKEAKKDDKTKENET